MKAHFTIVLPHDKGAINIIELPFRAEKRLNLVFEIQGTTRNRIRIGALRDDLLLLSEGASRIIGPSGESIKTHGTVHLTSGNTVHYFHVIDDKYLSAIDGILGRKAINSLLTPLKN